MVTIEEKPPSYFSTIFNEPNNNEYRNASNSYPLNPNLLNSQARRVRPARNSVAPEISIFKPKRLNADQRILICRISTIIGSVILCGVLVIIILCGISKINLYFAKKRIW